MNTFEFDIPQKEQDGSAAVLKMNRFLLKLLAKRMKEKGMTKKKLADILEVDKSTVSKLLRGNQNLTARTFGEVCGALDYDFDLVEKDLCLTSSNHSPYRFDGLKELSSTKSSGQVASYNEKKSAVSAQCR